MSVLTDLIYGGANTVAGLTEVSVNAAIAKYGAEKEIAFPDSAFYLPTIYAATGVKVQTLGDLVPCVAVLKSLITNQADLGQALNAGLSALIGAEIREALKYVESAAHYGVGPDVGFLSDDVVRSLGASLADGSISGAAVVLGRASKAADVAKIVRDYQSRGLLTFLLGDVIEQCIDGGIELGLDSRVIPLSHDITGLSHVATLAIRSALLFGGVTPGDMAGLLEFIRDKIPAVVNTFGSIDAVVIATGAGAIALGSPVVVDIDLAENQVSGILESVCDHTMTVSKSLDLLGIAQ